MSIAALNAVRRVPTPVNEPIKSYAPGSPERAELKARLVSMAGERIEIPLVIGGKEIRTGKTQQSVMPFNHRHVLADWHMAEPKHIQMAIKAALDAQKEWSTWPFEDRAAVLLKAAEYLATSSRATINAATMLGQAKTVFQSEIDAACELIDFWRSTSATRRSSTASSLSTVPASGTSWSTGRSRASSTLCRPSTSRPLAAICRRRRR
jgi:1-pyrroline-5-carboxylate dehydrogenase